MNRGESIFTAMYMSELDRHLEEARNEELPSNTVNIHDYALARGVPFPRRVYGCYQTYLNILERCQSDAKSSKEFANDAKARRPSVGRVRSS